MKMFHSYFTSDDCPLMHVVHECEAHAKVSATIACTCGECSPSTPCNCTIEVPCDLCEGGEAPEQSALRAIAVNHAFSEFHP